MEGRSLQQASFGGKGDLCYLKRLIGFSPLLHSMPAPCIGCNTLTNTSMYEESLSASMRKFIFLLRYVAATCPWDVLLSSKSPACSFMPPCDKRPSLTGINEA